MPTAEARAIFADAERLLAALRDLQTREYSLAGHLRYANDARELEAMENRLVSLRDLAAEIARQYASAIDRYAVAIKADFGSAVQTALPTGGTPSGAAHGPTAKSRIVGH
jgi:hypothetical protein